ncbi:type IV toxin-antitoxin system AbiEi family antitoxin domain-containing protein [Gulosibacter molinativorax]|uniref:DUF559 domain-containing protein n=1 Tax=Gulosibacter molinativorax TaxID=256821 RepID=A0ABT7C6U0_9MICO|nr:type IV toxin-antitoxin system AbiEi family antitoxin domain-containing protein [Gulosibacter molinativorax]MDJ1370928.1 DUF559 domain-containing protein [Gulosibacter molinativorax]QUY62718.1 Hypotetical protein [Gulosibacter molinativorax]
MDWDTIFATGHGVLTTADLLGAGIAFTTIRRALKNKLIRRISRGRYAVMGTLSDYGTARALNGVVSGLSALKQWGVWLPSRHRNPKLNIRVTRNVDRKHVCHPFRRKTAKSVSVRVLPNSVPDSYTDHPRGRGNGRQLRRQPLDEIPTAILVAEADCTWDELVAIGDSALQLGVAMSTLKEIAKLGTSKLRRAFAMLDSESQSGAESLLRARLSSRGINLKVQVPISKMHVDGLIGTSLVIEVDGVEYHRTKEQVLADRRRDRILHALGYIVLRFTAAEVFYEWDRVLREILLYLKMNKHRRKVHDPDDFADEFEELRSATSNVEAGQVDTSDDAAYQLDGPNELMHEADEMDGPDRQT